jgi:hypothetical protein
MPKSGFLYIKIQCNDKVVLSQPLFAAGSQVHYYQLLWSFGTIFLDPAGLGFRGDHLWEANWLGGYQVVLLKVAIIEFRRGFKFKWTENCNSKNSKFKFCGELWDQRSWWMSHACSIDYKYVNQSSNLHFQLITKLSSTKPLGNMKRYFEDLCWSVWNHVNVVALSISLLWQGMCVQKTVWWILLAHG